MALLELKIFSEALGIQTNVTVIIPQKSVLGEIGTATSKSQKNQKCLYLLHGLTDDNTIWCRRTSIERYAQDYGICVVMPNADKSFYTDMKHGLKYYTYISEELPKIINEFFNVSNKREDNFIAGNSMGGYGALKIGMKNCNKFSKIVALSAVCDIEHGKELFPDVLANIFDVNAEIPEDENLFCISEKCNQKSGKPSVYMTVGKSDFLYDENVKLKQQFEKLDFDYKYVETEGSHCWAFWDEQIKYALDWLINSNSHQ